MNNFENLDRDKSEFGRPANTHTLVHLVALKYEAVGIRLS